MSVVHIVYRLLYILVIAISQSSVYGHTVIIFLDLVSSNCTSTVNRVPTTHRTTHSFLFTHYAACTMHALTDRMYILVRHCVSRIGYHARAGLSSWICFARRYAGLARTRFK